MKKGEETKKAILNIAKAEFMKKGFKDASIRNIARTLDLTTGAVFRYFPDKESLFSTLVDSAAQELFKRYQRTQNNFQFFSPEKKWDIIQMEHPVYLLQMLDTIYENHDAFKLIICCSEGTKYSNYIDRFVELASENTLMFIKVLKKDGIKVKNNIPLNLIRILYNANFTAIFEVIVQDMPKEEAIDYVSSLFDFFNSGWKTLLHI
jgi:AcrR family transcriptional regulator